MKKLILFPIIALLVMTFISCEKDQVDPVSSLNGLEELEEMASSRANVAVPFKAEIHNIINPDYTYIDKAGNLREEINGIGKATHLGKSTWYSLTTVYDVAVSKPSPPFVQDGTMTFTTEDGSTLYGNYWGATTPCSEDCFFAGNGDWLITLGTKRFAKTTGMGTYSYVATMDDEGNVTSVLQFTGTLSLRVL